MMHRTYASFGRFKKWDSRPEFPWVAVWRQGGRRWTRSFSDQRKAKAFAHEKGIELTNEGRKHEEITDAERRAVHAARELEERLAASGIKGFSLSAAIEDYAERLRFLGDSVTVLKAVEEMLELREAEGRSRAHVADLRHRLLMFAKAHKGRLVASFRTPDIDAWLIALKCAPQSKANYRRVVHNLFAWCASRGYTASNPVTQAAKVKVPAAPIGILSVSEAARLLAACDCVILPAVAIGLFAGLRREEIARLDWREIDLEGGHIEVQATKSKTARRRIVEISDNLREWLVPYRQLSGPLRLKDTTYRRRFAAAVKAAGIKQWPSNALRHSFASYHLAHYQDAARTALQLGHTESRTLFAHYRELVRRGDAEAFWQIVPAGITGEKVVALGGREAA
jgi:integrase